jgi:hypothetical protein
MGRDADLADKRRREEQGDGTDSMDISEEDAAFVLGRVSALETEPSGIFELTQLLSLARFRVGQRREKSRKCAKQL